MTSHTRRLRPTGTAAAVLLALTLGAAPIAGDAAPGCDPKTAQSAVSFDRSIQRMFDLHCVECHTEPEPPNNLILDYGHAWHAIVGHVSATSDMPRIAPGDPAGSYLWHKIRGTHLEAGGIGFQMPHDRAPVPQDMIDDLTRWIADCAPDN